MKRIKIKINGKTYQAKPGATILEVVRENKIDNIPTLCHSPELEPYASCFVCVVEVKGRANLLPSCATKVAEGMEIETSNERIIASRKMALELLLSNHYADCVSPCMEGCPAGVDAQGYIALSAMGEYQQAVDLIRQSNPLPAICGRVCVRKCELVCHRQEVDKAVGINAIKRFLTDLPGIYDKDPVTEKATGKKVAIVGAGPAGLTAAWFLAVKGHKPIIFEANAKSGGMVRYGIPEYRLPDEVLDAEVDYICRAGAEIKYNTKVGRDISLDQLNKEHDAIFIASGAPDGTPMRVKGEDQVTGVVKGTTFLKEQYEDRQTLRGTIVVVGGGNTAMDVARTSWRLGADKVIILYRRTKAQMPADKMEIKECLEEGVEIMELAAPLGIVEEAGRLKALRCQRMKLGDVDSSGRRRPLPIEGSEFELPCQLVVSAIGQAPDTTGLSELAGQSLDFSKWDTFVVNKETMETNYQGVFAGGDNTDDGPTVIIDAIGDGQKAAKAIDAYLSGKKLTAKDFRVKKEFWQKPGKVELGEVRESPRHEVETISVEERKGSFKEVASGFDFEDNVHECERCLSCGCLAYDDCDLRRYGEEYGVAMQEFKGYVRKHKVDNRHPHLIYDPNKCILCAKCIRTCAKILPISALGLINRGFKTEMRPAMNDPLLETSCVSCGNCVDSCPTGALEIKYMFPGRAALKAEKKNSHCAFCSLACPITVNKISEKRYFVAASQVPGEYLCRYGRFGYEIFLKKQRIENAKWRVDFQQEEISVKEACAKAASGLQEALKKFGPENIAVFVAPDLTNEQFFLASKIARQGLKTNNIGSLSLLMSGEKAGRLDQSFGFSGSTVDRRGLDDVQLIICNNTAIEADHLILSADVIKAVKNGAELIVVNSALDNTDKALATLALNPMRGRASLLWQEIIKQLYRQHKNKLGSIEIFEKLLAENKLAAAEISKLLGVETTEIERAVKLISLAKKVVVIDSPDRPQDRAAEDLEVLANLIVLLKKLGARADLLLPQKYANTVGLEVIGADPEYTIGRVKQKNKITGASNRDELRQLLTNEKIKAALVIGEDPRGWPKTESWFKNVEFLVAMDWTTTETTTMANVVLPASTYLESQGTRINFAGKLINYSKAIEPAAGLSSEEVLVQLAARLGIKVSQDLALEVAHLVEKNLAKELRPYCWNRGEERKQLVKEEFVSVEVAAKPSSIDPPLTQTEKYKHDVTSVGTKYYRAS